MSAQHETAMILTKEGYDHPIHAVDIIAAVRTGAVVVVPRALQTVGLHERIVGTILNSIREVCSSAAADACCRLGLEQLHTVLDGGEIERATHEADRRLAALYSKVMKVLGHRAFGLQRSFYIHKSPFLRCLVPREAAVSDEERFMRRANRGHLSGHPPHRDYWFFNPLNAINVWIAVGPVERENGLLIYTDMWGKDVIRDGTFARNDDFGTPLSFALAPGDVALFDNRHLHASVPNVSASTRVVFSGRICTEWPVAPRAEALEMTSYWSPLVGTPFERFASAATKLSWTYVIERLKRRASSSTGSLETRIPNLPIGSLRERLRYRRGDTPFGA